MTSADHSGSGLDGFHAADGFAGSGGSDGSGGSGGSGQPDHVAGPGSLAVEPSDAALASLSINALEDEIGVLSSHINAATYRLLMLIAELDRREPWGAFGCKTCAHYLNWKCGIALSAAREKVRTARALRELPLISQAFEAGCISYSKARALTRVANLRNERALLDTALAGTATHVERTVRNYRNMQATASPELAFERRAFSCYWEEDGSLVFRGRLTSEQGAVLLKALEHAREMPDASATMDGYETRGADALVSISEGYLAAGGGPGRRTADRFQVKITAPVSCLALVSAEAATDPPHEHMRATHASPTNQAAADVETSTALAVPASQATLPAEVPVLDDGPALSVHTVRRLCCDGTIIPILEDDDGNPLRIGRKTRTVSPALRRVVDRRDGGCRFPGCTQTRHVDAHHILHWADGGPTTLSNLVSLCRRHHTWVHEGRFTVRVSAEGSIGFFNAYGVEVHSAEPARFSGGVGPLIEQNESLGIHISPKTSEPSWDGKPPDYDHIMFVLGQYMNSPQRGEPAAHA